MAFKPNYNFEKAERARAKAQKKQEKLKRLQEETEKRRSTDKGAKVDETDTHTRENADLA
jgi:hypothetical protein